MVVYYLSQDECEKKSEIIQKRKFQGNILQEKDKTLLSNYSV